MEAPKTEPERGRWFQQLHANTYHNTHLLTPAERPVSESPVLNTDAANAIGFYVWCQEEGWHKYNDVDRWVNKKSRDWSPLTSQEIYDLFLIYKKQINLICKSQKA